MPPALTAVAALLLAHAAALAQPPSAPAQHASSSADPDLSWLKQHAERLVRDLQADGHFARAADEGRPANYLAPRARDLGFLVHSAADLLDGGATATAVASTLALLRQGPAAAEPLDALPARAWLLAGLANRTANRTLLCSELPAVSAQLQLHYANASSWKDGLAWAAAPRVASVETVLSSGHDTLLSLLHYQALDALATAAERAKCGDPAPLRTVQAAIAAALASPLLLFDDAAGMLRASSGNNANLTDVWGSALAVETGAVTGERAARIVAWFGEHWNEVVQDGQIRHLPAVGDASGMPAGQYWPQTTTWQYNTYSNGGYWGEASGWVLPVIARNSSALAQKLVREAIAAAKRDSGL